jgi:hypothetical protein
MNAEVFKTGDMLKNTQVHGGERGVDTTLLVSCASWTNMHT